MKSVALSARVREITGKGVKKLRKEGLLPVGVYGKDVESVALSVPLRDFLKVYDVVGETGLVELKYDGKSQHTLITNVQIHPVSRQVLHAELHAVKLTDKIKAHIPIELISESPAVKDNVGVLLQILNEIEVEALPADLPEKIEVDVGSLTAVGDQVVVGDLRIVSGVVILSPADEIVVKVAPAVSVETAKEMAAEEAAKATGTAGEEGKAAETPIDGVASGEEKAGESKEEGK